MFREILMFLKSGIDPNINKLVEVVKQYGINDIEARVLSSAFLGWVEGYLNGATCPNCSYLITPDAREILKTVDPPLNIVCPNCGKNIQPYLINPYILTLTIMNKASIFDTVPDDVKQSVPSVVVDGLRKHWSRVQKIMEKVRPEDLYTPILSWMRSERPDLYFTILFYNVPDESDPVGLTMSFMCSTIYEINFYSYLPKNNLYYEGMKEKAKKCAKFLIEWHMETFDSTEEEARKQLFGREKPRLRDIRDAIITILDRIAKEDFEKLNSLDIGSEEAERIVNSLRISTEGIKWYATEIEEIYIKGCQMLAQLVGGEV